MSEENVEIVRRAIHALNMRDDELLLSLIDPEVEYRSAAEQKVYRGRSGLMQYLEDVDATLEDVHTVEDRFVDAGGNRVLHLYRIHGRGAGSGIPVDQAFAGVYEVRNGKLLRGETYLDRRQALEAVGLRE